MAEITTRRSTIYLDADLHQALRMKAASTNRSISEIVNEAVRVALKEDQDDLAAIADRVAEPAITYEELLDDLKKHGRI